MREKVVVFIDFSLSEGKVVQVKSTESKKHMEVCTRVSVLWRYYREQKHMEVCTRVFVLWRYY